MVHKSYTGRVGAGYERSLSKGCLRYVGRAVAEINLSSVGF